MCDQKVEWDNNRFLQRRQTCDNVTGDVARLFSILYGRQKSRDEPMRSSKISSKLSSDARLVMHPGHFKKGSMSTGHGLQLSSHNGCAFQLCTIFIDLTRFTVTNEDGFESRSCWKSPGSIPASVDLLENHLSFAIFGCLIASIRVFISCSTVPMQANRSAINNDTLVTSIFPLRPFLLHGLS